MSIDALWLSPQNGISRGFKYHVDKYLEANDIKPNNIIFTSIWAKTGGNLIHKRTKTKRELREDKREEIANALDQLINAFTPKVIITNDEAVLWFITGTTNSLFLSRGSVYDWRGVPVIIVDELKSLKLNKAGPWIFMSDIGKAKRWINGEQRHEPAFQYTVCRTLHDLESAERFLHSAVAISIDIETVGRKISCVGYTGVLADGAIRTYVIPFIDSRQPGNCFWPSEELEIRAWQTVLRVNANPVPKIMQNGSYDSAYFIRYHIPVNNYIIDTSNLFHSIWCEAQKKLNFLASIVLDNCRYWKDELKGSKSGSLPKPDRMETYWRYNALDCHNTMLIARGLLNAIKSLQWALANYNFEFSLQVGPALAMSFQGLRQDAKRKAYYAAKWQGEHEQALGELRTMCDMPTFNPNSSDQVCQLVYDVLGATPLKRGRASGRTADEKVLRIIATQHPIFKRYIQKIWDTKKPKNNYSKYVDMWTIGQRLLFNMSAAGTNTGRFASGQHQFWCGTNAQNIGKAHRDMFVADTGYVLLEIDYSQSDAMFVAFESEDAKYMATMTSGKDTHAIHCEFFFGHTYDSIVAAHKKGEDWVDHPLTGVRQLTKKIVHGANYQMQGETFYIQNGHETVVAMAEAVNACYVRAKITGGATKVMLLMKDKAAEWTGTKRLPSTWTKQELVKFADVMLARYHELYPGLRPWFARIAEEAIANGNRVTTAFGRTHLFFGDIADDKAIQRAICAEYGQGGTAGNINRSLLRLYYATDLQKQGVRFVTQTHDSILLAIPRDKLQLVKQVIEVMEQPVTIKGRTFIVRTDAEVGLSWGKGMMAYNDNLTYEEIAAHERKYAKKFDMQEAA